MGEPKRLRGLPTNTGGGFIMLNLELEEITFWLIPGILSIRLKRREKSNSPGSKRVLL